MCGIVAYIGDNNAIPLLIKGLYRLEYRGYDSSGISFIDNGMLQTYKCSGKVSRLDNLVKTSDASGQIGIAHTRWATHGPPTDTNAHPHVSQDGTIAIVHNGIIENYQTWKKILIEEGFSFQSDTDTEVIAHLIQYYRDKHSVSTKEALRIALNKVVGAYALVIIDKSEPDTLIAARKSSPLVFGIGENAYYLASDTSPIGEYTDRFIFLEDDQIIEIKKGEGYNISSLDNKTVEGKITEVDIQIEAIEKGSYPHYMLKEIYQQPETIADSMRGRYSSVDGWVKLGGLEDHLDKVSQLDRLIFVACGTSWHTALVAEYLIEEIARVPCEVEYASEFRYRNPMISDKDMVIAISQSGETADTLAALKLAKERGAFTYGIINVIGSSISRITDSGSYTHAGPEIGVASTKAFTSQLSVLTLMALQIGLRKGTISKEECDVYLKDISLLPSKASQILDQDDKIRYIAAEIKGANNALYLGRGYNFPVALEGALKLKEIYKILSNIEEVKARKGVIIAVVLEGDVRIKEVADYCIEIPAVKEELSPILSVIPLQLLAYHIAVMRGCDVDQPRNLAKSVTVE